MPVLVGGAAVELHTGGAYTTGDLDFVGIVPDEVAARLADAGFLRRGRHWIHEEAQVFIEFPGWAVDEDASTVRLKVGTNEIVTLAVEDLILDRLAAWEFWDSSVDGVNAFLLWKTARESLDLAALRARARKLELSAAWRRLVEFVNRQDRSEPSGEELEAWATKK